VLYSYSRNGSQILEEFKKIGLGRSPFLKISMVKNLVAMSLECQKVRAQNGHYL
jgi:hypothetical protein